MGFKDLYGNELKKVNCLDCNKDITAITHHKKGYCLGCAVDRKLIN